MAKASVTQATLWRATVRAAMAEPTMAIVCATIFVDLSRLSYYLASESSDDSGGDASQSVHESHA